MGLQGGICLPKGLKPHPISVGSVIYPAIKSKTLAKCYFSFWYHMEGEAIGSLNVYHTTGGAKTKVGLT